MKTCVLVATPGKKTLILENLIMIDIKLLIMEGYANKQCQGKNTFECMKSDYTQNASKTIICTEISFHWYSEFILLGFLNTIISIVIK